MLECGEPLLLVPADSVGSGRYLVIQGAVQALQVPVYSPSNLLVVICVAYSLIS